MGASISSFQQAQTTAHNDTFDFEIVTVDAPKLRDGDVLVKVEAAAINPVDHVVSRGILKDLWPDAGKLPFTPGYDFAGKIVQKGPGVKDFHAGQFVCGVQWGNGSKGGRYHADDQEGGPVGGSLAEYIQVPATSLVRVPKGMKAETAASLCMVAQTAYEGCFEYNAMKSGDKVIIFGGTTAVGQMAVQLAKNAGCSVFATCSTGKLDFVRGLGATPIDYTAQSWWEVEKGFDAGFITTISDSDMAHVKDEGAFKAGAVLSSIITAGPSTEEGTPKLVKFVFHQNAAALQTIVDDAAAGKVRLPINKTWSGLTADNLKEMFTEQKTAKSLGKNVLLL